MYVGARSSLDYKGTYGTGLCVAVGVELEVVVPSIRI